MKMPAPLFAALRDDFLKMAAARPNVARALTLKDCWEVFHHVVEDRGFTDNHPFFRDGYRVRVLPYDPTKGINAYYDAGLNDRHIETALRAILKI